MIGFNKDFEVNAKQRDSVNSLKFVVNLIKCNIYGILLSHKIINKL